MRDRHRPDDEVPWGLMAGVWLFGMLWWLSARYPERARVIAMTIAMALVGVYFWLGS